jgi:hypothetical protein
VRALTFRPNSAVPSFLDHARHGASSLAWKAARVGERLSPYVAVSCVLMAVYTLLIK